MAQTSLYCTSKLHFSSKTLEILAADYDSPWLTALTLFLSLVFLLVTAWGRGWFIAFLLICPPLCRAYSNFSNGSVAHPVRDCSEDTTSCLGRIVGDCLRCGDNGVKIICVKVVPLTVAIAGITFSVAMETTCPVLRVGVWGSSEGTCCDGLHLYALATDTRLQVPPTSWQVPAGVCY